MSVEIIEEKLEHSFQKTYSLEPIIKNIAEADFAVVAEIDENIVGFAAVEFEEWNNRCVLNEIFVRPENRGKGIGRSLIDEAIKFAGSRNARCLWLETQNLNYPAIQFYRQIDFEFCGFDTTLYNSYNETAFYFCKIITRENT